MASTPFLVPWVLPDVPCGKARTARRFAVFGCHDTSLRKHPFLTKAEEGLPTSDFRLPTSNFQLRTSYFQLPSSDFQLCWGRFARNVPSGARRARRNGCFRRPTMNLIKINEREQSLFFKLLVMHSVTYDIQKIGFLMHVCKLPSKIFDLFPCFTSHARVARAWLVEESEICTVTE